MSTPSRSWVFTVNNYCENDIDFCNNVDCIRIVVGQEESESGTPHLQGFITFSKPCRFSTVTRFFGGRAHWEKARSEQAANYCMKTHVIVNRDNRQQGKRTDIDEILEFAKASKRTRKDLFEFSPATMVRYHRGIFAYHDAVHRPIGNNREVVWIYGDSGVGKTRLHREIFPHADKVKLRRDFVIGYQGADVAVIDDLRSTDCDHHLLLCLLDRYDDTINVKGGEAVWSPRLVIVTTIEPPRSYVPACEQPEQLIRRITQTYCFPADIDECSAWLHARDNPQQETEG